MILTLAAAAVGLVLAVALTVLTWLLIRTLTAHRAQDLATARQVHNHLTTPTHR